MMNSLPNRNSKGSSTHPLLAVVVLFLSGSAVTQAQTLTTDYTVGATQGPWQYVDGGLNTSYQYGQNDGTAPFVLDPANGFSFAPGTQITIDYLSGSIHIGTGYDAPDANGDVYDPVDNGTGASGKVFPGAYFPSSEYPAYLGALVGTFADSSGTIVGTPFKVGNAMTLTVPAGATQLQLGINDDVLLDDTGGFNISVSGMAVPEPSVSIWLAGALIFGLAALRHRSLRRLSLHPTSR